MHRTIRSVRLSLIGIAAGLALLVPTFLAQAAAAPIPLAPDAQAYGLTLAEWSAAYLQWFLSIPMSTNPIFDESDQFASIGQRMPVWFLPGGSVVERTMSVPSGASILLRARAYVVWGVSPGEVTEASLRAGVRGLVDQVPASDLPASVDGVEIPNLNQYRVQSPVFPLILPADNVLNEPADGGNGHEWIGIGVGDGYWLLLPPLSVGQHVIQAGTRTYHLTVVPAPMLKAH
jgi:hypothetical protein